MKAEDFFSRTVNRSSCLHERLEAAADSDPAGFHRSFEYENETVWTGNQAIPENTK